MGGCNPLRDPGNRGREIPFNLVPHKVKFTFYRNRQISRIGVYVRISLVKHYIGICIFSFLSLTRSIVPPVHVMDSSVSI